MSAGHVVVGFDGSPAATAALRWAADEARLRGVPLIAYTVTGHHNDLGTISAISRTGSLAATR